MNYGEIKKTDIANGFGVRVSLLYPDAPTAARTASTARPGISPTASPSPPKRRKSCWKRWLPNLSTA